MKELKTGDKIVQQMTRDGAVEVNKSTSGAARISAREQSVSHVPRVVDRVQAEHGAAKSRAVKKANKKIYENTRRKPETPQLTFREREQPPNGKFTHIIKRPGREAARRFYARHNAVRERLYHQHGQLQAFISHPEDAGALRDILKQTREQREKEARPAAFKVRVAAQKQPSIKEKIAAGQKQLAEQRAAAPKRAAVKNINSGLEE